MYSMKELNCFFRINKYFVREYPTLTRFRIC